MRGVAETIAPRGAHSGISRRGRQHRRVGSRSVARPASETGSTLILALVFVIFVGGAIAALADFVMNNVTNTGNFVTARNLQYAASSTTNFAINSIRYAPELTATLNASPPSYCWGSAAPSTLTNPGVSGMTSWCSTGWDPTNAVTRTVTISTCKFRESAANCALQPYLQAVVEFDDYPVGASAPNPNACVVYCGTGLTIESWAWSPTVPVVTSVTSTPTISAAGGATISVAGSGFVGATTVNFVEENANVVASDNTVIHVNVTPSSINSAGTAITGIPTPPVMEGTTYYVTVTTPTGTSAYLESGTQYAYVTYAPQKPTITSATPLAGPTAGGTGITISGSGFYSGATVQFEEESSGDLASPLVSIPATSVDVISSTEITAVAPGITTGDDLSYWVFVTNPGAGQSVSPGPVFDYSTEFVPLLFTLSESSGNAGSQMTVYGSNFLGGATVSFAPQGGGSTINVTPTPANISPTTIVITVPNTLRVNVTYDVTVTSDSETTSSSPFLFT